MKIKVLRDTDLDDGCEYTIDKLLTGNNLIKIPKFQRDYTWKFDENIKVIFEDLINYFYIEKKDEYFLGTIVASLSGTWPNLTYSIIDGQQRITTLLLIDFIVTNIQNFNSNPDSKIKFSEYFEKSETKNRIESPSNIIKTIYELKNKGKKEFEDLVKSNEILSSIYDFAINNDEIKIDDFITKNIYDKIVIAFIRSENEDIEQIYENLNFKTRKLNLYELFKNKLHLLDNKYQTNIESEIDGLLEEISKNVILFNDKFHRKNGIDFDKFVRIMNNHIKGQKIETRNNTFEFIDLNKFISEKTRNKESFIELFGQYINFNSSFKNLINYIDMNNVNSAILYSIVSTSAQFVMPILENFEFYKMKNKTNAKFLLSFLMKNITQTKQGSSDKNMWDFIDGKFIGKKDEISSTYFEAEDFENFKNIPVFKNWKEIAKLLLIINEQKISEKNNELGIYKITSGSIAKIFKSEEVDIEHIYSQKPDKPDKRLEKNNVTDKIGNLAILEKAINGQVSSFPFIQKVPHYQKSKYSLKNYTKDSKYNNSEIKRRENEMRDNLTMFFPNKPETK